MGLRLIDYLDKGASLDPDAPCLTTDGRSASYADVRSLAGRVAEALASHEIAPGDKVEAGQPLAVVEAMKMENILRAEKTATVKSVSAAAGDSLAVDQVILELE